MADHKNLQRHHTEEINMKKKMIAALLIGTTVSSSLMGCGSKQTAANDAGALTSPTCIEAEYPAEAYSGDQTSEIAYSEQLPSDPAYASDYGYSDYEAECASPDASAAMAAGECMDSYNSYEGIAYAESAKGYEDSTYCPGYITPHYAPNTGENYRTVTENPFTDVASSPLSTFGADIDTASYSNLRRMINDGYSLRDIPSGSIRTEELINYFNYDYKTPGANDKFAVNASIIDCPWNRETKLVNLGIKATEAGNIADTPSNIVFLIDVSGSMNSYDKLPLLQMGFDMLVDDLDENDRVSIVTYASSSDVVIAGVPGNEHTKIKRAINDLSASGSTNGGDGIKTAYKLAEKYFIKGGNNRVIMATDGDLNVGITSEDELEDLISKKKEGGVFLSVLGFGTGNYNETTLETLADKGNGNYSYIDCLSEAKKTLIDEFNSTLFTVAKDVKFQTEFNPKYVSSYRLIGYEHRQMAARDFSNDTKDGGEIGSGHRMTALYEIVPADSDFEFGEAESRYQNTRTAEAGEKTDWLTVSIRAKEPEGTESKLYEYPVTDEAVKENLSENLRFAAAVAEAGMLLRESEWKGTATYTQALELVRGCESVSGDAYKEEFVYLLTLLERSH